MIFGHPTLKMKIPDVFLVGIGVGIGVGIEGNASRVEEPRKYVSDEIESDSDPDPEIDQITVEATRAVTKIKGIEHIFQWLNHSMAQ